MQLYKDFTLKSVLRNVALTEELVKNLPNVHFIGLDVQTDHYFETSKGKLKLRQGIIENLITHYERITEHGIERTFVYQYDLNPPQQQIDELFRTRKKIGEIRKQRKIYLAGHIKFHIDQLTDGMEFIEIEAIDRENLFTKEELAEQCRVMQVQLGILDSDLVKTGYFEG
ncbi:MAG TPA: CYTH domain-containing protein [Daejeonella sp.]|nr:CYTH domain-containing protein [Daejeonella sp.]